MAGHLTKLGEVKMLTVLWFESQKERGKFGECFRRRWVKNIINAS